tara:strand:- start:991 stop:1245 length:255 start_codon:yes stop_codon:yes gene_type:complete
MHRLIDDDTLHLVAGQRAAALWLQYVAPLDREVRRDVGGDRAADRTTPVDGFWSAYVDGVALPAASLSTPPPPSWWTRLKGLFR